MKAKILFLIGLGLYAALSAVDFVLTFVLLELSGGRAYESNPVAAAWLDSHGWHGLAVFKACGVLLFVLTVSLLLIRRPKLAVGMVGAGCIALLLVVCYSQQLIAQAHHDLNNRDAAWGPAPNNVPDESLLRMIASR